MPLKIPDGIRYRIMGEIRGGLSDSDIVTDTLSALTRADILAILEANPEPEAPFGGEWNHAGELLIGDRLVAWPTREGRGLSLWAGDGGLACAQAREILAVWESSPAGCNTLREAWEAREGGR